jgi:hypothetical protein
MSEPSFRQIKDAVAALVTPIVEEHLADKIYRAEFVQSWGKTILGEVVRQLGQFEDFKFVTTCIMVSKDPNEFYTRTHSVWDRAHDGSVTISSSNGSLDCHVTVYGLKY